jgi:hypothetical protein
VTIDNPTSVPLDHQLYGALARYYRAGEHMQELSRHVERFFGEELGEDLEALIGEYDASGQSWVVSIGELPVVPPEWAPLLGDAIQNLRAVLDYVIAELSFLDSGGNEFDRTGFPVSATEANYADPVRGTFAGRIGNALRPESEVGVQPQTGECKRFAALLSLRRRDDRDDRDHDRSASGLLQATRDVHDLGLWREAVGRARIEGIALHGHLAMALVAEATAVTEDGELARVAFLTIRGQVGVRGVRVVEEQPRRERVAAMVHAVEDEVGA